MDAEFIDSADNSEWMEHIVCEEGILSCEDMISITVFKCRMRQEGD